MQKERIAIMGIGCRFLGGLNDTEPGVAGIGAVLPPTSLMRARTIGQIASLISEHLGCSAAGSPGEKAAAPAEATPATEVDVESLSDEDIEQLLGAVPVSEPKAVTSARPA